MRKDKRTKIITHNLILFPEIIESEIIKIAEILRDDWVFRGQSNSDWSISTSMEREVDRNYDTKNDKWFLNHIQTDAEKNSLKKIKSYQQPESPADKTEIDDFSWLALLQHHGCATRLVDFTESFYIALYFAVRDFHFDIDNPFHSAAVWAIDLKELDKKNRIIFDKIKAGNKDEEIDDKKISRILISNSIDWPDRYSDDKELTICYGKPIHKNKRLKAQQGIFLCPLNLDKRFIENLTVGLDLTKPENVDEINDPNDLEIKLSKAKVIKITILQEHIRDILSYLDSMDINEASLFPGLDGYARSLNYFFSKPD